MAVAKVETRLACALARLELLQERAKGRDTGAGADHNNGGGGVGGEAKGGGAHEDDRGLARAEIAELCGAHALHEPLLGAVARFAQHLDGHGDARAVGGRGRGGDGVVARRELGHELEHALERRPAARHLLEQIEQPAAADDDVGRVLGLAGGRGKVAQPGRRGGVGRVGCEQPQHRLARGRADVSVVAQRLLDGAWRGQRRRSAVRRGERKGAREVVAEAGGDPRGEGAAVVTAHAEVVRGLVGQGGVGERPARPADAPELEVLD